MPDRARQAAVDPRGSPQPTQAGHGPRKRRRWLIAFVLLVGCVSVLLLARQGPLPGSAPLEGELLVGVSSPGASLLSQHIDEPGALPARAGGGMQLVARFKQPAYVYLVWLDSQGKVTPLYPWNQDEIEVKDANQPPPARGATRVVVNPSIGDVWRFGNGSGLQTVLLLARRTPLPQGVQLGSLLGVLPPVKMRQADEAAILGWDHATRSTTTILAQKRGTEAEAREVDQALLALMDRLADQFEFIRAVRFAHDGE